LERTDYSARMAFVDYDGEKAFNNYLDNAPKTHSDRLEFVKTNAPRIISGLNMIENYFDHLLKNAHSQIKYNSSEVPISN